LPGHNSQDTCLFSAGDQTRRGRFWKEATQAGPSFFREKDAGLALELKDPSVNIGLPCKEGGIIHKILRGKIV